MLSRSTTNNNSERSAPSAAAPALRQDADSTTDRISSDSNSSRTRRLSSLQPLQSDTPARCHSVERKGDVEKAGREREASSSDGVRLEKGKHAGQPSDDEPDPKMVTWSSADDPDNPQNWSKKKKWRVIIVASTCSLCVTCNSSIVASTYSAVGTEFGISRTVAILGLSFFVGGLGVGPLFLAPFSEAYGRRPIYLVSFACFVLLQLPIAFANNAPVYLIFRLLVGMSGSAFLSVAGGTVVDMFNAYNLFPAMCVYTGSPFGGPSLGPLIGEFIVINTTWRWVWWTMIIWSSVQYLLIYFLAPETFAPKLLTIRAQKLRKETGDQTLYSAHEKAKQKVKFGTMILSTITKVPTLLYREAMLCALCLWSALLLGILYAFFQAYPIVFEGQKGFTTSQTGMAFLGQAIGIALALCTVPYWSRLYQKAADKHGGVAPPEERLPMCMVGAFLTVIGLFIFAFTTYPSVHWSGPIIGSLFFGAGILYIYSGVFTYTTSCWKPVAASAMAANSLVRSSFAAAFPLFTTPMYRALGTVGATALLAGLNVLMIPIPFVLYKYGAQIRARSSYTM